MEDNLHDTGFLLKNLMENMTDNIYFKDAQSRFLMVNKAYCEWAGLEMAQVIGKTDFDLFAAEHAQQAFDDEQRIMATGEPIVGIEEKETWADGHITWVSTTKMPLRNAQGEIIGTFGLSRDITDHKEAQLRAAYYAGQVRRIKEEMEDDVRMAAELQKTFFPRSYPEFPPGRPAAESRVEFLHHYHASGLVSGDFCTIRRISDDEAGIFLCDVMGHGIRAALVTALVCALVEETSGADLDPGPFLERMNKLLLPTLRQEDVFMYATACYLVFNTKTGVLRFANAGHPMPLHFRAADQTADWLALDPSLRGPALAIDAEGAYRTAELQLRPGDSVVMFTDGLYEVAGQEDEEFGEDRLLQSAQSHTGMALADLFHAMANDVQQFARDGRFDDDVCIVGLTCRSLAEGQD